jgi:hypothetical protein
MANKPFANWEYLDLLRALHADSSNTTNRQAALSLVKDTLPHALCHGLRLALEPASSAADNRRDAFVLLKKMEAQLRRC